MSIFSIPNLKFLSRKAKIWTSLVSTINNSLKMRHLAELQTCCLPLVAARLLFFTVAAVAVLEIVRLEYSKIKITKVTVLSRTPSTKLNRSDESRHPCLVPNLRGKYFSLSSKNVMLSFGF